MSCETRSVVFFATILVSALAIPVNGVSAQCGRLTKEDGDPGFEQWQSVSVSLDRIAVGTLHANFGSQVNVGAVYVFRQQFGVWVQEAKLYAPAISANYYMGPAVSISGPWIFAGVGHDSVNGYQAGAVHVYHFNGAEWVFTTTLTPSDAASGFYFGDSVSIDGNRAVVGAPYASAAYVFAFDGANWIEEAKLTLPGIRFGDSVAIRGDTIIVGAPYEDTPLVDNSGAAYVFRLINGSWVQEAMLTNPAYHTHFFGEEVSLTENAAVVLSGDKTEALVFERESDVWSQTSKVVTEEYETIISAGIDGDLIVVGAESSLHSDGSDGVVYLYSRTGDDWVRTTRHFEIGWLPISGFGSSVAIRGNQFVAGSSNSRYVYAYSTVPSATDCNHNCVPDATEFQTSSAADCNENGLLDGCDLAACDGSTSCGDCNYNGAPDGCDLANCSGDANCGDCNFNGILDSCDIANAAGNTFLSDCNQNGHPDLCDINNGSVDDVNDNTIPDSCECSLFDTATELLSGETNTSKHVRASLDRIAVSTPARVFRQVGNNWVEELSLDYGTGSAGIALDGDVLAVSTGGWIDVYRFDGASWVLEENLVSPNGVNIQQVAISGDRLLGAARFINPSGYQGTVHVFRKDPGGWVHESTLVASDGQASDFFGTSVAIDGEHAVVGAVGPVHGPSNGAVYVFRRTGTTWIEEEKILPAGESNFFGVNVAIDDEVIVIGTSANTAYSYHLEGNDWVEEPNLVPIDAFGQTDSVFGYSVAISNGSLFVGSPAQSGVPDGSAHLFYRDGNTWSPVRRFVPLPQLDRVQFGLAVALGSNAAYVGSNNFPAHAFSALAPDCDGNGQIDLCQVTAAISQDCNANSLPDACDISSGLSADAANDSIPDECQCIPNDCADNNVCTHDSCMVGQICDHAALASLKFGDVNADTNVNLDDLLCVLAGFSGQFTLTCPHERVDMVPCAVKDGLITLDDILASVTAFGGGVSAGCAADLCAP